MSKSWIRRAGTTASTLMQYCKAKHGKPTRPGVKMVELVCMGLEMDGRPCPVGVGAQHWIALNLEHIKGVARKQRKATKDARAAQPPKVAKPAGPTYDEANAPEFLSSYAWRSLRFRVLQHYGARCMCCGATPETGAVMNVDHIKPRRTHPHLALEFENLQVLCHDCNHGKANTVADFRPAPIEPEVREFLRAIARQ